NPRYSAGPRGDDPDGGERAQGVSHHLGDRRRAGRSGGLPAGPAIRRAPGDRPAVRPDHLHDLRARRPWKHGGRLYRRLHLQRDHRGGRLLLRRGVGLCGRFRLLHRRDDRQAGRPAGEEVMSRGAAAAVIGLGLLTAPVLGVPDYYMHILILILIWSLAYTAWSIMGRFGLTSLGHGAFMGIG